MPWLHWFTRNWADTVDGDLAPLVLAVPPAQALAHVEAVIRRLPRWELVHSDPATGAIRAIHRTRLIGFADDVTLRLEPVTQGTRVHARSQARVGFADLGQNRRNLQELFAALGP